MVITVIVIMVDYIYHLHEKTGRSTESKNPQWTIPFMIGVYHLHNNSAPMQPRSHGVISTTRESKDRDPGNKIGPDCSHHSDFMSAILEYLNSYIGVRNQSC